MAFADLPVRQLLLRAFGGTVIAQHAADIGGGAGKRKPRRRAMAIDSEDEDDYIGRGRAF